MKTEAEKLDDLLSVLGAIDIDQAIILAGRFRAACQPGEDMNGKYQEALDAIQTLVNTCGVMSPVWKLPRAILERERPILPPEDKPC